MANRTQVANRIPRFSSLEEAAAFWDTHDSTEFEDEFERVELEVARPLVHSLEVEFDGATFQRLIGIARGQGLGPAAMVRAWVEQTIERLSSSPPEGTG